jgi:hypothetical protein
MQGGLKRFVKKPFVVIPAKAGHIVPGFKPRGATLALSSHFNSFWTPAFAGVTESGLFTKPSTINRIKMFTNLLCFDIRVFSQNNIFIYIIILKGVFT